MLHVLGLIYGAVSLALDSLGLSLSQMEVYETVQTVAARVPGLKREEVWEAGQNQSLG
jgi:hypothetical protein